MKKQKVIVVMPAFNAEKTLKKTFQQTDRSVVDEFILVDDGSNDNTVLVAKKLGIKTFVHPQNRGYGGNQKTCYTIALNENAGIVVMVHPDYQYDSSRIADLIQPILKGNFDIMMGSRIRTRTEALVSGMPLYKYLGNRFLTVVENILLGQTLSEYHTGFRAYKRKVLLKIPFHKFSDDFVFDQQLLISAIRDKFKVGEIPIPARYFTDSSSISFKRSVVYGFSTLYCLALYLADHVGIFSSVMFSKKTR